MEDLSWIFKQYSDLTDKLQYVDFYSRHFSELDPKILLEIGVLKGGSLRIWKTVFPDARIAGIDSNEASKLDNDDLEILIGDQKDPVFLEWLLSHVGIPDIIIDDGGHCRSQQIFSFEHLFPHMKSGGVYVIEDLEACLLESYNDYPVTTLDYMRSLVMPTDFDGNTTGRKVGDRFTYHYSSITFEPNICMITKR